MIELTYWFVFPVAFAISTLAIMGGFGGAILFTPFLILVLKLEPLVAITLGLFIEVIGFGSGLFGYIKEKLIDYDVYKKLILFVVVGATIGTLFRSFFSSLILTLFLALILLSVAYLFLRQKKSCDLKHPKHGRSKSENHEVKNLDISKEIKLSSFFGAFLVGSSSSGLGEINEYNFNEKLGLSFAHASGTSVLLISVAALIGSLPHLILSFGGHNILYSKTISILLFSLPGVIIGGQLGVLIARRIKFRFIEHFMGTLFLIIGIILILSLLF